SFEYEISAAESEHMVAQLVEFRPANATLLPASRWKSMLDTYGLTIIGGVAREATVNRFSHDLPSDDADGYKRELFDLQGSYTGHYGKPSKRDFRRRPPVIMSGRVRARREKFARPCRERGAHCFHSCPPHPTEFLTPMPKEIETN